MATMIRDLTRDLNMSDDTAAAILRDGDTYWFAGGRGFHAILDGEPWDATRNTPEDWAESYPTLDAANDAANDAMEAVAPEWPVDLARQTDPARN